MSGFLEQEHDADRYEDEAPKRGVIVFPNKIRIDPIEVTL
jgi:hypothetical protein